LNFLIVVLAVLASVSVLFGLIQATENQYSLREIEGRVAALGVHANGNAELLSQQVAIKNYLLDQSDSNLTFGEIYRSTLAFDDYLDKAYFDAQLYGDAVENDQVIASVEQQFADYQDAMWRILENPDLESASAQSVVDLDPVAEGLRTSTRVLADYEANEVKALVGELESQINTGIAVNTAIMIVLILVLAGAMFIIVDVSAPLQAITSAVVAFENNTYRTALVNAYMDRKDETGQLARAVDGMATSITEANKTKERFLEAAARFVPTQYMDFLEKPNLTQLNLGDHVSAEMAVMFSDIRGFTSMSEGMSAKENFDFVNEYLKLVSPLIQENEGFIVKFLGDGMMAIFPYGVDDAVKAGIAKQQAVRAFNDKLSARGLSTISVGIGIHTGPMMVGMIGENQRMQGDAFSDNVNLTSRIEGLNKFYGTSMIISQDTLDLLPKPYGFRMRYLGKAVVKGRTGPLPLYEIYEGLPDEVAARREATRVDFERGVSLFAAGQFQQAGSLFNQVLDQDPKDHSARMYLERCAEMLARPLPANWDGAIVMDAK
jgi:class 3 adenylate cyclase